MTSNRGLALVDVLAATGLSLVLAAMAVPVVGSTFDRERVVAGTEFVAATVQRARLEAFKRGTTVAVRVAVLGGRTAVQLFCDGNGNGVLQRDIDRAVDLPLTAVAWLDEHARGVSLRINQPVIDAAGTAELAAGDDPLRIGNTSLVSFSPLGNSTSGTLYIAARRGPQLAIRIFGATGRTRLLVFDPQARQWRS